MLLPHPLHLKQHLERATQLLNVPVKVELLTAIAQVALVYAAHSCKHKKIHEKEIIANLFLLSQEKRNYCSQLSPSISGSQLAVVVSPTIAPISPIPAIRQRTQLQLNVLIPLHL